MPNTSLDPHSTVEMVMATCSLNNHPSYEALSYTGGNPYSSAPGSHRLWSKGVDPWEATTSVMVNGISFPAKQNLIEALRRFRVTHAQKALWTDNICINEADPVERTEQVRLMGEIYGEATDVPIWLGERTAGLDTALALISDLIAVFTKWYDENHTPGFHDRWERIVRSTEVMPDALDQKSFWEWLQSEQCRPFFENIDLRHLGIRTDDMAWAFLRDLINRRWFARVWTWQEKELATRATVYIGDRTLLWVELRFAMLLVMAHDLSETRVTPNMVMPGREYLHVLDSLGIGRFPDLLDMVINVRHRETKLRRDKIFGVLGAAAQYKESPSESVAHFSRLINYGDLTDQDLYKEFSRYWILEKRDLRVLQACNPSKKKLADLPSWVADWSDTTPSHQLSTRLYKASQGADTVDVKYHYHVNPSELHLAGIPIDTVKLVCNDRGIDKSERHLASRTGDGDYWRTRLVEPLASLYVAGIGRKSINLLGSSWRAAAQELDFDDSYAPTSQSMPEAFWRTLLSDQNPYVTTATDQRIHPDMDIASLFDRWAHRRALTRSLLPESMRERKDPDVPTQRWLEALHPSVMYKRFFVTERGSIGLAPSNIQVGDIVCVFLGGKVPFAVRRTKNEEWYTLVEETYLHGFMDGEAVEAMKSEKLPVRRFALR